MSPDEMIAVIQAKKEGKVVEYSAYDGVWEYTYGNLFDFTNYIYRVKPTKKVSKWQWVCKSNNEEFLTACFFATQEEAQYYMGFHKVLFKADWTHVEVEVPNE